MKLLFVGQAPSRSAGRKRAFDGPGSGRRLASLLGLTLPEFLEEADTANLLPRWPGKHGGKYAFREKGDRFPVGQARRRARRMMASGELSRWPLVVLCGRRVARAFGVAAPLLSFERLEGAWFMAFPHPSGCNLWWNDPRNAERAGFELRMAFGMARRRTA